MFQFINTLLIGITSGAIYALMALSIVLVWRSTRVINFAQAGQALTSTFIGFQTLHYINSFWIALLVAMIGGALISALIEVTLMRVLLKHSSSGAIAGVAPIIATLGLLEVIQGTITLIWGGADVLITPPLSNVGFTIGTNTLVFSPMKLAIIIIVLLLLALLSLIFQKTSIGLSLRAAAYSPELAHLGVGSLGSNRRGRWVTPSLKWQWILLNCLNGVLSPSNFRIYRSGHRRT
jgi:branched-chain amino acid transport system permease protein